MMPRKELLPKNVSALIDRHGKRRYRFRKVGCATVWFTAPPSEADIAPLRTAPRGIGAERHLHGTAAWLLARFYASPAFLSGKGDQRDREARRILAPFAAKYGKDRVEHFRFDHVEAILMQAARPGLSANNRKTGGPHAARNLRGELLPLFNYAVKLGLIASNPVAMADAPADTRPKSQRGFHTWTEDEIAQYRAHWPLGSKARLALEILLWTLQRKGDAATFGPRHLRDGKVKFEASKNGKSAVLPVAPQLREAIDAAAIVGTETYLVTAYGKPFSKAGLGNKMREWCNAAGLPQCSAHGLRKATARRGAEQGGGNQGLKALGQWSGDSEVAVYTAAADQERMAEQTLAPVIAFDLATRQK